MRNIDEYILYFTLLWKLRVFENRTEQNRTEQNRTEQNRTEHGVEENIWTGEGGGNGGMEEIA